MPEVVNSNQMSEVEFLKKSCAILQRHIANLENTVTMMRGGQFIDAYARVGGSREGLDALRQLVESRVLTLQIKDSSNENNTN